MKLLEQHGEILVYDANGLMYNLVCARRDHKGIEGIERNNSSWSMPSRRAPGSISGSPMSSYREAWDGAAWFSLSEECRYKKRK